MENLTGYLEELGLTHKEAEIYVKLLKSGPKTGMELSKIVGSPAPLVYKILRRLEDKKVIYKISNNPMVFKAYPLDIVTNLLINERERELNRLSNIREGIIKIFESHAYSRDDLEFDVLRGIKSTMELLSGVIERTGYILRLLISEESIKRIHHWHRIQYERASARGVSIRVLTSASDMQALSLLTQIGEVKKLPFPLYTRFVIKDYDEIVILTDSEIEDLCVALYSKNKKFTRTFADVFDYMWNDCKPTLPDELIKETC